MANIIEFRVPGDAATVERNRERRGRAKPLLAVLEKNRPMSPGDQWKAAVQLGKLLARLENQGVAKKSQVMKEAGLANDGDSTKHLGQYAISPRSVETGKMPARLNKKPEGYLKLTEAASRLSGKSDIYEELLEVFGETDVFQASAKSDSTDPAARRPVVSEAESKAYEDLAQTLRNVATAISTKHKLQTYFQEVARIRPSLIVNNDDDLDQGRGLSEPEEIDIAFDMTNLTDLDWPIEFGISNRDVLNYDSYGTVPPYPAVVLGAWDSDDVVDIQIQVSKDPNREMDAEIPASGKTFGRYRYELRFCIVPIGKEMWPTAALRLVTSLHIHPLRDNGKKVLEWPVLPYLEFPTLPYLIPNKKEKVRAIRPSIGQLAKSGLANEGCEARTPDFECTLLCAAPDRPTLISRFDLERRGNSCLFLPVTSEVLQDLTSWDQSPETSWDQSPDMWDPRKHEPHIRVLGPAICNEILCNPASSLRVGTVACELDRNLSGQAKLSLVDMLDARAGRLVTLLAEAESEAQATRATGYRALEKRLHAMRDGDD